MEPTPKSEKVEAFLEGVGLDRTQALKEMRCVSKPMGCGAAVTPEQVKTWSDIEQKEYRISGLCKDCQDEAFAEDDEWDDDEWDQAEEPPF